MRRPIAVITGDVHFTLQTLDLATAVLRQGLHVANHIQVPFILNGDTLDGKAIVRGEIMNRLLEIVKSSPVEIIINTGNHDLLSAKAEESALNFLAPYCTVVRSPVAYRGFNFIPYQITTEKMQQALALFAPGETLIVHQGVQDAFLGHYVQDTTSLPRDAFSDFRVIASHYHRRQDIACGDRTFSYIGSPYSITFTEAEDGPKGINILYNNGDLELVPTNLRKHVKVLRPVSEVMLPIPGLKPTDLLWLQVSGPYSELEKLDKAAVGQAHLGHQNFKLEKLSTDAKIEIPGQSAMSNSELLDEVIEAGTETKSVKAELKSFWRTLV